MKNPYLWYSLHYKCCLVISKIAVPTTSCNYNIIQEIIIMHLDVCDILLHIFVHQLFHYFYSVYLLLFGTVCMYCMLGKIEFFTLDGPLSRNIFTFAQLLESQRSLFTFFFYLVFCNFVLTENERRMPFSSKSRHYECTRIFLSIQSHFICKLEFYFC